MKLEGKIIVAQPIQSGVSKNGNNWQRQDFVLEIPGQYPKKVAFSVMNSNIQNFGLAVGQDVDIEIDINANEWQGKWFNSITCWKATLRNPGQPTAAQQPQTYYQVECFKGQQVAEKRTVGVVFPDFRCQHAYRSVFSAGSLVIKPDVFPYIQACGMVHECGRLRHDGESL